jgi:hypothetical protein
MQKICVEVASGEKIPHPRHWVKLAEVVGVLPGGSVSLQNAHESERIGM